MMSNASLYKSSRGYAAMMRAYATQLARWPVPAREMTVPTRYGETHLLAYGPDDAPPLVLVHGLASNALIWRPNAAALSRTFRIYAPDAIGDAGKSAPARPALRGSAYADWLVDVFDGLGIDRARVVGISLGGWMTLKVAIHAPERVERIMPLCPAGLVPYRLSFAPMAVCASLFPNRLTIASVARALCAPTGTLPDEDAELLNLSLRYHRSKMVPLRMLTDAELGRITAPTLLLVGEHEAIFSPQWMVDRACRTIRHVRAEIIPDAGHALNSDQPDALHERIVGFMGKDGANAAA